MSSNSSSSKVVSVDEQAFEKAGGQAVDEDGFPVVDETPTCQERKERRVGLSRLTFFGFVPTVGMVQRVGSL